MKYLDLSHTIINGMHVFPGEKSPTLAEDKLPDDAGYTTFRLESNMHTGTHIDAPFHVLSGDRSIDSYPVEFFTGRTKVIDVRGLMEIGLREPWIRDFLEHRIILFCTGHSFMWGTDSYYASYPVFSADIAVALKEAGVRIVGFDIPSPDGPPYEFHSLFLSEQRFMVENLTNLEHLIDIPDLECFFFPLKIRAEASLVRAVARF